MSGGGLAIPLAGLMAEGPGSRRHLDLEEAGVDLDEGLALAAPVSGGVEIVRTNRGVLVAASLRGALAETCARCLRPAIAPLDIRIDEEVLPSIDLATGRPVDTTAEPDVARLTDHHELDLASLIREAISLAEPIAPLCEPDCPGLCPDCGERLGPDHIGHAADDLDPRLAALRAFRVDGRGESE